MATSTEENKKIARKFFELFRKGDVKEIGNLWASNYKFHFPGQPVMSSEESKKVLQQYVDAFPDKVFKVEDQISEGDTVVTRISVTGTHKGNFMGIAATNKKINATGIATHRISNGKIVEEWTEFDM